MSIILRCTNLEFLNSCHVRYLLASRGFYSPPTEAATRGITMHTLLEFALQKGIEHAHQYISESISDDMKKHTDYFVTGLEQVLIKLKNIQIELMEEKLRVDLGFAKLVGKPDLICASSPGSFTVVDFKTSAVKYDEFKIFDMYQLVFYAYMLIKLGVNVNSVSVVNIYGQKKANVDIQIRKLTNTDLEWIESFIKYASIIEKRGVFSKNWISCNFCDYKNKLCKKLPQIIMLPIHSSLLVDLKKEWDVICTQPSSDLVSTQSHIELPNLKTVTI